MVAIAHDCRFSFIKIHFSVYVHVSVWLLLLLAVEMWMGGMRRAAKIRMGFHYNMYCSSNYRLVNLYRTRVMLGISLLELYALFVNRKCIEWMEMNEIRDHTQWNLSFFFFFCLLRWILLAAWDLVLCGTWEIVTNTHTHNWLGIFRENSNCDAMTTVGLPQH